MSKSIELMTKLNGLREKQAQQLATMDREVAALKDQIRAAVEAELTGGLAPRPKSVGAVATADPSGTKEKQRQAAISAWEKRRVKYGPKGSPAKSEAAVDAALDGGGVAVEEVSRGQEASQ